jgi:D-tyrosyl-tRNA(Tyr) deacylase
MRIVLQKVRRSFVEVGDELIAETREGYVLFLAIKKNDSPKDADFLIEKILKIKLFSDPGSDTFMQYNIKEVNGTCLVVSQFTLYGKVDSGTKVDFSDSADFETAKELYNYFILKLKESLIDVQIGDFGEHMEVELINDGPITLVLDS